MEGKIGDAGPSGQMWNTWISHSGSSAGQSTSFENAGAQDANGNTILAGNIFLASWMLLGNYKTSTDIYGLSAVSEDQDGVQKALKFLWHIALNTVIITFRGGPAA